MDKSVQAHSSEETFEAHRERIRIEKDALVQHGDSVYRITSVLDFNSVVGIEVESGRTKVLAVGDLRLVEDDKDARLSVDKDLSTISDDDWRVAQQRYVAILPLLGRGRIGESEVAKRAKEINVNKVTLYRWIKRFNAYGTVSALIPMKRGWQEGKSRVSTQVDEVIEEAIREYYLTQQRPTAHETLVEVRRRCLKRGIEPPSHMTVRARINRISEKEKLNRRGFVEKARYKFQATPGHFPGADYPLAMVQIDHTRVDIILVDDEHRLPITRPWLTLAIDVYSRMVVGYHLSFESPSETSVGMCVAHAILPKEEWLALHEIKGQWPVWGVPKTIHTDNGADFRSDNFSRSCLPYGIKLEFRPLARPHYGGHIERLIGTLMRKVHKLPGTTFSNVAQREGYDSEKNAVMSKSEFERWLVNEIVNGYHNAPHKALGMSPLKKWEIGIFGNAEVAGIGMPPRPADRHTVLLDFLPTEFRTVQPSGVTINRFTYYDECLRPWINARDPKTEEKIKLAFRLDLRDLSYIWFFDPKLKQYFKVPSSDMEMPSVSMREYRQLVKHGKAQGIENITPQIFNRLYAEDQQKLVDDAKKKTKKARLDAQRNRENRKNISPAQPRPVPTPEMMPASINAFSDLIGGDIDGFGGIA